MASGLQTRIFKLVTGLHVFLYHASSGKIWGSMNGNPVLMLTTTGSKTGLPRTTPVMYVHKDNEYLIAASAGGSNQNPTWLSNLNHNPQATIEINGKQIKVKTVITSGDERDRLYENFKAMGSNFIEYEKKTTRKIPVIRLQPVTA
ncbi:MAG: nitroreductase family deazaflavin-dependent oxidoreductase [Anaerolineae bacterium]|nr:nitroreductase family deazaflavin-dependent oxidoreductase [Anaerolineae bacterium]